MDGARRGVKSLHNTMLITLLFPLFLPTINGSHPPQIEDTQWVFFFFFGSLSLSFVVFFLGGWGSMTGRVV